MRKIKLITGGMNMWFKKWRRKKKYLTLLKRKYLSIYLIIDFYIALSIFYGNKDKMISISKRGIKFIQCDPG